MERKAIDRLALDTAIAQTGQSLHAVGDSAAQLLGEPERGHSIAVALSPLLNGTSRAIGADRLEAIERVLGRVPGDLSAPVLWAFRDYRNGRPIQLGLALPMFSSLDDALKGCGFLAGIRLPDEARGLIFADDPQPFFASDRDRWLEANFDQLDEREREFVVTVDPDEREMRSLWYAHLVTVHDKAEVRQRALAGLAGLAGLAELADAGALPAVDFATLADLAQRRLLCERLRDAPAPLYDRWKAEAKHLEEAATRTGAMS